jgi:hypothetical protein
MTPADGPRLRHTWTIFAAAVAVTVVAITYLIAWHVLSPAIVAGDVPILSAFAQQRGWGIATFLQLTSSLSVPLAILVGALALVLAPAHVRASGNRVSSSLGVLTAALATVFVLNAFHGPIVMRGDANDYFLMNVSMSSHGTPELRASDIEHYSTLRVDEGVIGASPYDGYFVSPVNGARYCWHFWLYPAFAAPAHWLLDAAGVSPLRAYELTNVLMFLLAMYAIIRVADLQPHQRLLFAGLFVASPVAWYMSWPSAEVFTASLVVLAIALFTRTRYVAGVLAAALGATMNPTLLVLVAALAVYALVQAPRAARVRHALLIAGASAVGLAAMLFNYSLFRAGNLIQWAGMASTRFITPHKLVAFFLSLDQGLLPYAPVALVLGVAAVMPAVRGRDWWVLGRFTAVLVAVTLTATTIEWNSDAAGLRRHALWIFPFLLWLGVEMLARNDRRTQRIAAIALGIQLLVFAAWVFPPGMVHMSPVTEFVLTHAPAAYSPVPSVFSARTQHLTVPLAEAVPVIFESQTGARKVLVNREGLARLDEYLVLDEAARDSLTRPRGTEDGLLYVEFPKDSARMRAQDTVITGDGISMEVVLGGPSQFGHEFDHFNDLGVSREGIAEAALLSSDALWVSVRNGSAQTWYPGGGVPIGLIVTVDDGTGAPTNGDLLPLVRAVLPGERVTFYAHFVTPARVGTARISASLVQADDGGGYRLLATAPLRQEISVVAVPAPPDAAER